MPDKKQPYSGVKVQIPVEVVQSASREGFFRRVQQLSAFCERMCDAYRMAEHELEEHGLPRRYADYNSFRKSYYYWVSDMLRKEKIAPGGIEPPTSGL